MSEPSEQEGSPTEQAPAPLLFRVESGQPSAEQVAALSVVLAGVAASTPPEPKPAISAWARHARRYPPLPAPGPQSWRASSR